MNQIFKVLASGSSGNCYLLKAGEETLILECGIKWKDILKGLDYNLDGVVGCLVTHEHQDHCKAMKDVIKNGIDVYSSKGTFQTLITENRVLDTGKHRLNTVKAGLGYRIGDFIIWPFRTIHDTVEPLGYLIQHKDFGTCVFATDTKDIPYIFPQCPKNIFVECNYWQGAPALDERILKTHMSLENCKEFLKFNKSNQLKHVVLLHLSDRNSDSNLFKEEIEGICGVPVYIAEKNLEIQIGGIV